LHVFTSLAVKARAGVFFPHFGTAYSAAIAMMTNEIGRGILVGASFDRQECL
jgi:hypothetical protein